MFKGKKHHDFAKPTILPIVLILLGQLDAQRLNYAISTLLQW